KRRVILHRHAQRNTCHFTSIRVTAESRTANTSALFLGQSTKLLSLFVCRRRANAQARLLEGLLLLFARNGDVEFHLVALGLCIFRHPTPTLRDTLGLHLKILRAPKSFD